MPRGEPLFMSVYGINGLVVNESHLTPDGRDVETFSKEENSWTYTSLASAINIGIKMLETPEGKRCLLQLGRAVIQQWVRSKTHRFGGNPNHMAVYVDHFLSALRQGFPQVTVIHLGGPDILACTRRMTPRPGFTWDGNLHAYRPNKAVGLYFNMSRVADMVGAASVMWQKSTTAAPSADKRQAREILTQMTQKYKEFQFIFASATTHELCHAFVGYLAQNSQDASSYTPPNVNHLDYGSGQVDSSFVQKGESGRYMEKLLFGGALEFYRDPREGHNQVGIPHILDQNAVAFRVDPKFMSSMVESSSNFRFPFPKLGSGISEKDRVRQGVQSLGSTKSGGPLPSGLMYMRSRQVGPVLKYNITQEELSKIPVNPRPLRAQRVATM
ncbi:hypothetical protein NXS19_005606 [Fusarium pseudograminearum]|uniref:Uncharacterized protein n=1 Tax=Fusarium pseudograminearum (strain CS3096) TaxID=1028729 RepID=K3V4Q9_FUSPC|nr:hypothetical protein FPSE_11972 [Fusarium pseudograminearum CS3096]EKJ67824.1 hypothetical protein FPSE_11972 [Fusarium pseudograminearum CS3096]KAF0638679.1 hypothetical protein FPSE5266_11972 [Fusarium pseudograminearum]UZP37790.1 hypothetical protein NXS19_005606 [Fusarium pseudograminearum]